MTDDYEFTQDWFHWAPEVWTQLIPYLPDRKAFLEVGSFEGRSTVWIMENMMDDGGSIDCIDTWEGGEEHTPEQVAGIEERFDANIEKCMRKFSDETGVRRLAEKWKGPSWYTLSEVLTGRTTPARVYYDFIYIDGSHVAKDVMIDACMAWQLLKKGGVMVFDDYLWGEPLPITHKPKLAIDYFTTLFAEELEFLHIGYQLVVRKKQGAS